MSTKNRTESANGERRAIVGYNGQYRTQACLLLRALQAGDLEWVKIIDSKAEKLDDFQMGRPGRIDAYQVKWSEHPSAITFHSLASNGFLKSMADGWRNLGSMYSPVRIVAHFVTNHRASTSTKTVPFDPSRKPNPAHFSAFLKQSWEPMKKGNFSISKISEEWKLAWVEFQEASGLKDREFKDFIDNFELDLDFRAEAAPYVDGREAAKLEDLISKLEGFFFRLAASPERSSHLTRDQLLNRLGWANHYEFRNPHQFPVDHISYEPLQETAANLKRALEENKKGYICVLGSPGSGKSTLLTDILSSTTERVIRYYAFIPDDMGPTTIRGESANFLHDVTLSLRKLGYRSDGELARASTQELRETFYKQIQLAGAYYRETQCRTLILIDGLDHVRREQFQHLDRDFFGDLPQPSQIPEGVLFVLGSQTLDPLSPQIKSHLESSARIVTTTPLTSLAVGAVLDRSGLNELSPKQRKQVFDYSAGHPLALRYIVNLLVFRSGEVDEILETVPQFKGDIDATYRAYWEDLVANDDDLRDLMALIARLRHQFDLPWVMKWAHPTAVRKLVNKFAHFFSREDERHSFFHNSFRQFVVKMTSQPLDDNGRSYHHRLAEIHSKFLGAWNTESLYHLAEAEAHEQVLEMATQEFFRVQFFDSRPSNTILQDIRLARRSLQHIHDPVAAVRLSLISKEIWKREDNLMVEGSSSGVNHNLLLATGHVEEAIAQVRRGMSLLISCRGAIQWSRDFLALGHVIEARRIFLLIDPVSGAREIHGMHPQKDQQDFLVEWAVVALDQRMGFFSIDRVIDVILSCEFDAPDNYRLGVKKTIEALRNEVLTRIAINFLDEASNDLVTRFESSLNHKDKSYSICIHELEMAKTNRFFELGDLKLSKTTLEAEFSRVKKENLSLKKSSIFDAAELYAKLKEFTRVGELIKAVGKPPPPRNLSNGSSAFVTLFRYYRLCHIFGHSHTASDRKDLVESLRLINYVKFDELLNDLAWMSSHVWIDKIIPSEKLKSLIRRVLDYYESDEIERFDQDFNLEIKYSRSQIYTWLTDACVAQGETAKELLIAELERRWDNPRHHKYWHPHIQRDLVTDLFQAGADRNWAYQRLEVLESEIPKENGGSSMTSECSQQAAAWLTIGEPGRADAMRDKMMRSTFHVGYSKDNQLVVWLRLAEMLNTDQPDCLFETLRWFSKCIVGLNWAVDSSTTDDAASELVGVCAGIHPTQAFAYLKWFDENQVIYGQDARVAFLLSLVNHKEAPLEEIVGIMARVILPYLEYGNWYLMERLVVNVFDSIERGYALKMTEKLVKATNVLDKERKEIWSYGLARGILLSGVDLQSVGLSNEALRLHAEDNSGNNLQRDADTLTIDELEFANLTVGDLRDLRQSKGIRAYFNWHQLIRRIAPKFDKKELICIAEDFRDHAKFILILESMSDRLIEIGGKDELRTLTLKTLESSDPHGWSRSYDGGTRMAAFNLLLKTDRPEALRLLYDDCADYEPLDPSNLHYLLPLIATTEQRRVIWLQIQEHLQKLLEGFDENIEEPPRLKRPISPLGDQFSAILTKLF